MKHLVNKLFSVCILLVSFYSMEAQQPIIFSQYMDNQTPYNPAYSLLDKSGSVSFQGRRQWVGVEGAPSAFLFTGSVPVEKLGASAGIIAAYDEVGVTKSTEINAFIAKSVQLADKSWLALGFNAGFYNYNARYASLSDIDPEFSANVKQTIGNIGAGLLFYNPDKYYIGISMPKLRLKNPGGSSTKDKYLLTNTYCMTGGALFTLDDNFRLKPAFLLTYTDDMHLVTDASATLYLKDQFGLGVNYRSTKEVAGILSFRYNNIRVGYSYQTGIGTARKNILTNTSHEITLGLRFGKETGKPKLL